MRTFMYIVIVASMLAAYLSSPAVGIAPGPVKFVPDLLSAMIVVYVFVAGVRQQFCNVNPKYWLVFGALALVMVCGPLVNQEGVGPILNGMRYYLRAIPLFFLPAVFNFSDRDLSGYMKWILALSILQAPLAVYQRITQAALGWTTGDYVFGTLMISGIMSMFLIAVLCVMVALMLRGRIGKFWFWICFVILLIPMSINETKVTMFVLPVGLLVTFLVVSPPGRRLIVTLQGLCFLLVAGLIFVPIYNHYNKLDDGTKSYTAAQFLTDPTLFSKYMDRKAGVGTGEEAGRFDSLKAPFRTLSEDPIKLTFGLGLGNVSQSSLGEQFQGRYKALYWNFAQILSVSTFLFEIGIFGTLLVLVLHWVLLRDILFVARNDQTLVGILALGFVGVWTVVTIGLLYLTIHTFESISFMFWFFAGVIAARRERMAVSRTRAIPNSSRNRINTAVVTT